MEICARQVERWRQSRVAVISNAVWGCGKVRKPEVTFRNLKMVRAPGASFYNHYIN
jgi:hypothetical protein